MAAKKGKLRSIRHEIHTDGSVSYEVNRESTGGNKGSFLMDTARESGTHKSAKAAGDHLRKVLRDSGVKDSHPDDNVPLEGKGKGTAPNQDKNKSRGEQ